MFAGSYRDHMRNIVPILLDQKVTIKDKIRSDLYKISKIIPKVTVSRKSLACYHMRRCLRPKQRTAIGFIFSDPLFRYYDFANCRALDSYKTCFRICVFFTEVFVFLVCAT